MKKVISLHFLDECNLNCPFCYRSSHTRNSLDYDFWIECASYLSKIAEQVALGGGEPFYSRSSSRFVEKFSIESKKHGLICNCTTNGKNLEHIIKYGYALDMISVSYDTYKWPDIEEYISTVREIKAHFERIGCNFLITQEYLDRTKLIQDTKKILEVADYVYFLMPKKTFFVDVLKIRDLIFGFAMLYRSRVFVDDCLYHVFKEKKYCDWSNPCHYGQDVLNLNQDGSVTGCSFEDNGRYKIKSPKDILNLAELKFEKRHSCPHLACRIE